MWVEPSGVLVLLLSKTDAFDDFSRLLKIGRVRVKTTPARKTESPSRCGPAA
jgi:hypothetical protein